MIIGIGILNKSYYGLKNIQAWVWATEGPKDGQKSLKIEYRGLLTIFDPFCSPNPCLNIIEPMVTFVQDINTNNHG